jgi:predicted DsbA family dithiol-disulfide isomerase
MRIDFVFDTVCPWCYVGKRRFERALALRPGTRARVNWIPFLLNPDVPLEGVDRRTYLDRKFGGPARVQRMHAAVAAAGRSEGIDFAFDRILRTPNTLHSHRLVRLAGQWGRDAETVEALYRAYFTEGRDIGALEELITIAGEVGLPQPEVADHLYSDADMAATLSDNARAHRLGVNGVPCLIVDGVYALAGAQDPDILLRLVDIAREAEAEAALS